MRFVRGLVIVFLLSILTACANSNDISALEASRLFQAKKAVIVDVREPSEWREQHIEGAIFMPLGEVESRLHELADYKDTTVIMQCRSGKRSAKAAAILVDAGFNNVLNLEGGIIAWDKANLPTVAKP